MLKKFLKASSYWKAKRKLFPYKIIRDEFYDALYLTINGSTLFIPENLYCIDLAMRNLPTDDPVIEIGSFTGMSTGMLIHFLEKNNRTNVLFNIDKWEFEEKEKAFYRRVLGVSDADMKAFIRQSFIRNMEAFCPKHLPQTIELFSDEFFNAWKEQQVLSDIWGRRVDTGGGISFAYVDGNHQYEFVKRDFENIDQNLVNGGFIFFDDSSAEIQSGMKDFVNTMRERKDYEVVLKNPNYLFVKSGQYYLPVENIFHT